MASRAQVVLTVESELGDTVPELLTSTLVYPAFAAISSCIFLLFYLLSDTKYARRLWKVSTDEDDVPQNESINIHRSATHIDIDGGRVMFLYRLARVFGCLGLLAISSISTSTDQSEAGVLQLRYSRPEWAQWAICATFVGLLLMTLIILIYAT